MLGLAKWLKSKTLQASTSEAYGNPKEHPQYPYKNYSSSFEKIRGIL